LVTLERQSLANERRVANIESYSTAD